MSALSSDPPVTFRPLLLLTFALVACEAEDPAVPAAEAPAAAPTVADPYASPAPENGTAGAFLTVRGGAEPDTLVAVRSADVAQIELHRTETEAGLRTMREVEGGLPVPARGSVELRPGSYHLMLIGLRRDLAPGDTLDAEVEFARAGAVPVRVPVRSPDAFPAGAPSTD